MVEHKMLKTIILLLIHSLPSHVQHTLKVLNVNIFKLVSVFNTSNAQHVSANLAIIRCI
jgi:hypothetical protein